MEFLAYLDPGTGAIIIQALIAGIVGAGFAVKLFWANIKSFFQKLTGKEVEPVEVSSTPDTTEAGTQDESK